MVQTDLLKVES